MYVVYYRLHILVAHLPVKINAQILLPGGTGVWVRDACLHSPHHHLHGVKGLDETLDDHLFLIPSPIVFLLQE